MINLRYEDLLRPSDPLICDPLVAVEHRATLMIHPRVDRAIRPPEKVQKKSYPATLTLTSTGQPGVPEDQVAGLWLNAQSQSGENSAPPSRHSSEIKHRCRQSSSANSCVFWNIQRVTMQADLSSKAVVHHLGEDSIAALLFEDNGLG